MAKKNQITEGTFHCPAGHWWIQKKKGNKALCVCGMVGTRK